MGNLDIIWTLGIDPSGYSSCARSYVKSLLQKANIKTYILNIAKNINNIGIDKSEIDLLNSLSSEKLMGQGVIVQHSVPDLFVLRAGKNVGYTVLEMEPPKRWVFICNQCDLIMTPSVFSKQMMVDSGIKQEKIKIIPHCHDPELWNPSVSPLNIKNLKSCNFLFIGDYTPRKGGDLLIKNYVKTFSGKKDVSLTIKGYFNSFSKEDQISLIDRIKTISLNCGVRKKDIPTIYFYGEPIMESHMPRFMKSFDCLVLPHHGEGWSLNLSQSQFLGVPTIGTRYSGNLDFMNDDISYFIDIDGFEKVPEEMSEINPNFSSKEWVKIKEDSLCDSMLYVYNNLDSAKAKGALAAEFMKNNFSYEKISNLIIKTLGELN